MIREPAADSRKRLLRWAGCRVMPRCAARVKAGTDHGRSARGRGLVVRRIRGDWRRRDRRLRPHLAHDDAAGREVRAVVGDGAHVLVPGRQIGALVSLGVGDRAAPSQLVPDRKGIFPPARVEMIPIGRPVGNRLARRHGALPLQSSTISTAISGQLATASRAFSSNPGGT